MTSNDRHPGEHDPHIDTVLYALGHADAGADMQARLLATLHRANAARRQSQVHARPTVWHWQPRAAAPWLAAAVLLCAAGGTLLHHWDLPHLRQHADPATSTGHVAEATEERGEASGVVAVARIQPVAHRLAVDLRARTTAVWTPAIVHAAPLNPASIPSPPLPMTEQERLLLRIARHEPSEQLAQLTGPARDAAFQREKDAVTEFFATAPALEDEENDAPSAPQPPDAAPTTRIQTSTRETP